MAPYKNAKGVPNGNPNAVLQTQTTWRDWLPAVIIAVGLFGIFMLYTFTLGKRHRVAREKRFAEAELREKELKGKMRETSRPISLQSPITKPANTHLSPTSTLNDDTQRIDITNHLNTPTRATFGEIEIAFPGEQYAQTLEEKRPARKQAEEMTVYGYAYSPPDCTCGGGKTVTCLQCHDDLAIPPPIHHFD